MNVTESMRALTARFEVPCDDDAPWIRLESARWLGDALRLRLRMRSEDREGDWSVTCAGVLQASLDGFWGDDLRVLTAPEHPLNAQFLGRSCQLYFKASTPLGPEAADTVAGALFAVHRERTEGHIPFERFLNLRIGLRELIASGDGLLADGPRFLLEAYADALERHGVRTNLSAPTDRRGEDDGARDGCAALVIGEGVVVARSFDAAAPDA
ncbi:MAG: hypothetical protein AAGB93_08435 [Planctomycetota bacterium]